MHVTEHALERSRERLGLCADAAERIAVRALDHGIKHAETTGRLKKYLDRLYLVKQQANNIRIYGEAVYLFAHEILITVIPLPHEYKAAAAKIRKRKEHEHEE